MFSEPFRGSATVAAGLVTFQELRGPRFRRLFHDVYVAAEVEVDLALRSRAAYLLVVGHGAVGGWSAAELLGASCGSREAPAEVITCRTLRPQPGLRVRRDRLAPDEITTLESGIVVTSPLRTAFDLGRRPPRVEGVVAVDALARVHDFHPAAVAELGSRHRGGRGVHRLGEVLALADPRSGSPMETRIRLALVDAGLPVPQLQYPVGPYLLDLAYPAIRLAMEYDGREHRTAVRALRDLDRQAHLTHAGWKVLRFPALEVHRPTQLANRVTRVLQRYARHHNLTHPELLALLTRCAESHVVDVRRSTT